MNKPLFTHCDEVYSMLDKIKSVFDSHQCNVNITYGHNIVTLTYVRDDGLSVFDIDIMDWDDDTDDEWMGHQFDSCINVAIWRNEQICAKFNGAFEWMVLELLTSIITK